jgi:hypothetical protein
VQVVPCGRRKFDNSDCIFHGVERSITLAGISRTFVIDENARLSLCGDQGAERSVNARQRAL